MARKFRRFDLSKVDLHNGALNEEHEPQVGDFYRDGGGVVCAVTKVHEDANFIDWWLVMATGHAEICAERMPAKIMREGGLLLPKREIGG